MPQLNSVVPPFDGVPRWRNGPAPAASDLAGRAVLVHFFSSGCPLCREGMPVVRSLGATFGADSLAVVGAFQPRPDAIATVAEAERECDELACSTHACAMDVDGVLAARFGNKWAPAYYIFDRGHRLRHYQMGNWNLDALAAIIEGCVKI